MTWIGLVLTFALAQNVVLVQLLGICPCVGAPRRMSMAVGVGLATMVMMSLLSLAAWAIQTQVLVPLGAQRLQILALVAAAAALGLLFETAASRVAPILLRAAGFSLRGITVNCAVLGTAILVSMRSRSPEAGFGPLESLVAGFAAGCGVLLVLVLMSAIREKLDIERVPAALRGLPIALVSAGLLALAFLAFDSALLARLLPALRVAS